jgi:hypothetical protein
MLVRLMILSVLTSITWELGICLTRRKFLQRCNEIWTMRNLPRSTGHEFRIGGTTHLLLSGLPPDVVKALG